MPLNFLRTLTFVLLLSPLSVFAAPHILYTDIVTGPNTGGEGNNGAFLTIFGNGFGVTSGTVTIGGGSAVVKAWSDTQITVQPGSAARTGTIAVNGNDSGMTFTVVPGRIVFVSSAAALQPAIDAMAPGDHVVIRGGTYSPVHPNYQSFFSIAHIGGTAAAPIVVMGYPGETVLFSRTTQTRGIHSWDSAGHFVIANLHVNGRGSTAGAISLTPGTVNVRVVNNEVTGYFDNGGGSAAIDGSGRQYRILGNHVHDNAGSKLYHALYFDARSTSDDIEIAYNHIHHQGGGRGIQIYGDTGTLIKNVRVHHNVIHDIALDGILFGDDTSVGMKAYNNVVYRTANPALRGRTNDEGDSGRCIRFNDAATEAEVYNNTFVDCDVDGSVDSAAIEFQAARSVVFRNNIIVSGRYSIGTPPATRTISHNLWSGGGAIPSWSTNSISANPAFVDTSVKNYRLNSGSAAIDAGVSLSGIVIDDLDGNMRPQGGAYDIGAFESSGVTLAAPQNLRVIKN